MKMRLDPFVRFFLAAALVQSSVAPVFAQTRIMPVRSAPGIPAVPSSAGSLVPTAVRLEGGLGGASLAPSVIPALSPQGIPAVQAARVAPVPSLPAALPAHLDAAASLGSRRAGLAPAATMGSPAPAEGVGAILAPGVELSEFSAEKLGKLPDAGAHDAGQKLERAITRTRHARGLGDAVLAAPSESADGPRRSGLAPVPSAQAAADRPYSPWRLTTFLQDPEKYALTFIFGADDTASRSGQGYELLVGLAVHEAFEDAYKRIQRGTPGKDVKLEEIVAVYERAFDAGHKGGQYAERDGWKASEYKRRGAEYIAAQYEKLAPFESQGKVLALEERVLWTMTDPATKKSYQFKGRIDRLMLKGDTVYIRDWKTHFSPPALTQLERDDFQLGLYALGLMRTRPDLVKGRKIVIAWDFKEFSQEIVVDDAYVARIEARVFDILRRIEGFTERVEAEKAEWLKRLHPDAKPAGVKRAKAAVDELGAVRAEMDRKAGELRGLRRAYKLMEEGITRFATRMKLETVAGKRYTLKAAVTQEPKALPTKSDDPEAYEALARALKDAGLWDGYSTLDAAALRRAAEALGGEDHEVFQRLKEFIASSHVNEVEVVDGQAAASGEHGGVVQPKVERPAWAADAQPGVLSPTQLDVFLRDQAEFARRYILRLREDGDVKPMGTLAGSAIHETMEQLFVWIKGGRQVQDIQLADLLKHFDQRWEALKAEGEFAPDQGLTEADYKRGSKEYIKAKWDKLYPFDNGRPVFLEKRMFFTVTDPRTGRSYKFQGIPDRVMIEGDAVVIRDWKSHYKVPSDEEVKRKDYQLGLYILALRQLYPDMMKGRKSRLVWDFRDKEVVIEVDDAYLKDLSERLFAVLRDMDGFKDKVASELEKWEEREGLIEVPKSKRAAAEAVDKLGRLADKIDALEEAMKPLKERSAALEDEVAAFSVKTGWATVQGARYASKLVKRGTVAVPTKGRERQEYDAVVRILKEAGLWEKYSGLDLPGLKKAIADPKNPDRAALKAVEPYLRAVTTVRVRLEKVLKKERPKKKAPSAEKPLKEKG